jgi:hypothetical protein
MNLQPTAQKLAAQGRNGDTMLVHMSPGEVGGLQALAMAHGGSLSINPKTGLPEAFFLAALVPTLLGALAPTLGAAATGAGLTTLGTFLGSKMGAIGLGALAGGLMNKQDPLMGAISGGFGGYGGAGIGNALGAQGGQIAAHQTALNAANLTPEVFMSGAAAPEAMANYANAFQAANVAPTTAAASLQNLGTGAQNVFSPGMMANLGRELPSTTSQLAAASPFVSAFSTPAPMKFNAPKEEESDYEGPYLPTTRNVMFPDDDRRSSKEFMYFSPSNPVPYAEGGDVDAAAQAPVGMPVTRPETDVYRNIANIQQLAGLPSITNVPAYLMQQPAAAAPTPAVPSSSLSSGLTGERDYGFGAPGRASGSGTGGLTFYKSTALTKNNLVDRLMGPFLSLGSRGRTTDPSKYEAYTPEGRVDMADYIYDPALGGFVQRSSPATIGGKGAGFKQGGNVSVPQLEDGGFVLTKKAVDGLGKGSNTKGQRTASAGLGAIPIKGKGHGTSDSIKTSIDGKVPARVSNGEAYIPRRNVKKAGGAQKLYALMRQAERRA